MKKISILLESRCSAASLLKSLRILPLILLQYCLINAAPDLRADNGGSNSSGFWISESSWENFSSIVQLKLLVALPLDQTRNYEDPNIQIWDRGLEMLPGAQLAVEAINKDPRLLTGYELKLENVVIKPCIDLEQTNAFIPFTNGTLDDNTVGIVGLFCYKLLRTLSPLAGRREFGLFQLSGTTSTDVRGNRERYSHLNFVVPSESAYYETFFRLMNALGWRRALIIDDNFPNMIHIPNFTILTQNLNISDLEFSDNVILMANEIRRSEKNIVFMSTSTRQTASLLCAVYDYKLLWPHYVWVLQDHEINELLRYAQGAECTTKKLTVSLQNTFFLRSQHKQTNVSKELVTGSTYETYMQQYPEILNKSGGRLKYNRFANTMHDSVWAFALALNHSLDALATYNANVVDFVEEFGREELTNIIEDNIRSLSFEGVSGRVEFNQEYDILAFVDILLHASISGELLTVGHYNYRNITINRTLLPSDLPPDSLPNIYYRIPFPVTVLLVVLVILCFVFTTFTLVLFIKYRQYSEIKATSPYLSLLMFVGTYFILTSTLIQAISTVVVSQADNVVSKVLCGSVITGNIVGINLIFSTLLLRMLRIYRIFSYFGKTGKLWSDKVLVIIVLIIVGTDLLLILIWFFADPFTVKNSISYKPNAYPPYYEIRQFCSSKEIGVWFSLTFGKVGILFAIVLFLAIKTRKIQRANFKDTKKVNIYIFITVLIVATLIPLWFFLKETGNVIWTGVVIYTSFGVIGLLCQLFLFAPKVLPPLLRSLGFSKAYHSVRNRYHQETIRKYDDDYESTMFKYTLNSVTPRYSFIS